MKTQPQFVANVAAVLNGVLPSVMIFSEFPSKTAARSLLARMNTVGVYDMVVDTLTYDPMMIMWDTAVWQLVRSVNENGTPGDYHVSNYAKYMMLLLQHVATGRCVMVFGVHLPRGQKGVRSLTLNSGAQSCLTNAVINLPPAQPAALRPRSIVVAGDFNMSFGAMATIGPTRVVPQMLPATATTESNRFLDHVFASPAMAAAGQQMVVSTARPVLFTHYPVYVRGLAV